MRYGSVCSGIEAATVAWHPLGWRPAFYSEIDKFPRAVLAHHYPHVPLHGDFTTIREGEYEPIDLLVGGTPCQSFSIAGLRGGLGDARGNLALAFLQLARRSRARWLVWENVPGVLSSDGGRDFGSILGGLAELGYGFAYRVLDAQYFGVPQRRRRVFVVAHSSGDSRRAAEILFEPESLRGNHKTSRAQGQGIADASITGTVSSKWAKGTGGPSGDECYNLVPVMYQHNQTDARLKIEPKTSQTVIARFGTGGGHTPLVRHHVLVRKLTPTECERLQGFPDGYTDIMPNTPDGSRYVALGNSMAVPVMRWIGKRIAGI